MRCRWPRALAAIAMLGAASIAPDPSLAADKPLCRLSTSEVGGYRGQMELSEGVGGQMLSGYLAYRFPDDAISLNYMEFAPGVPIKVGLMLDFSVPAKDSGRAVEALGKGGISDLRVFVGRLTGTSADVAYNKGADVLKSYKPDFSVSASGGAGGRYVPVPQSRFGADTYSFGGGDLGVARLIARPLLADAGEAGSRLVTINLLAGAAKLEASGDLTGYRSAAKRLFGGADALRERAARGLCVPARGH